MDTVSCPHTYNSLPRTIGFVTSKMGFHDTESFHFIGDTTLPDFMALLMGKTREDVRGDCAPNWFASCL